jgi:hypothetical protein
MSNPIVGYEGTVKLNGTTVAWVSNWKIQIQKQQKDLGPFLGDAGAIYTFIASQKITGSVDATIPTGKDAGQTALVSGSINNTPATIELVTTGGYTITIPSGILSNFTMTQDAADTAKATFDFMSNGAFSVV